MNLQQAHDEYGWPDEHRVLHPSGGGPAHLVRSAEAKIAASLRRFIQSNTDAAPVKLRTGVLCARPDSDRTEAPLAVVCEFKRHVSLATLLEAHRLAWNYAHAPLLVTLEPSRVLVWSCSVPPAAASRPSSGELALDLTPLGLADRLIAFDVQLSDDPIHAELSSATHVERGATQALHWVNLLAGRHFEKHPSAFRPEGRLDATLIANLNHVRSHLHDRLGLPLRRCHDLLARLIFIQFLFHRRDAKGEAALNAPRLARLAVGPRRVLRQRHADLASILSDHGDAYRFFEWLNGKFNGDLFPGKSHSAKARRQEWAAEKAEVTETHLSYLARFITGQEELAKGQRLLWSAYAFDTIPLELVSSIYETFVEQTKTNKAYYTRGHLVDFMLDAVLPWEDQKNRSDLRILDPSCGSGIFLVKAFQRLVHRWKKKHGEDPEPADLKRILAGQIYGVDIHEESVRVSAFSLYLALCDELEPRRYWTRGQLFPPLRGRNLIARDFFSEDQSPFRTKEDAQTFDLVIGNAPWGKSSADDMPNDALGWAKTHGWKAPGKDIGPIFLPKAAKLVKPEGMVSMIQSGSLLLNRMKPAKEFRRRLFAEFAFEEVIHLGAVRKQLFAEANGPACILTYRPNPPLPDAEFAYVAPKLLGGAEDRLRVVIEPHDIHFISHREVAQHDHLWGVLLWAGRRDLTLINKLLARPSLDLLRDAGQLASREGFIRGKGKGTSAPEIVGRRFLHDPTFPNQPLTALDASTLPVNLSDRVHRRDRDRLLAFDPPQLLFKQSWSAPENRFHAAHVIPDAGKGALCSGSYVSFRALDGDESLLAGLWLLLNSSFACFWFPLMGGKFANFTPEATETELRQLPALRFPPQKLPAIAAAGHDAIDHTVLDLLGLSEAERILVKDLHQVVLPDAQRQGGDPPGYQPVTDAHLDDYAATFLKVLSATFGDQRPVAATIFESPTALPVRLVAIHLGEKKRTAVRRRRIQTDALLDRLRLCHDLLKPPAEGIGFQRVIEVFAPPSAAEGTVHTLYLVKPAQRRYWLRSLAMRDADRLGAQLFALEPAAP